MTHHPAESTLHALVDGELAPDSAAGVEAHVLACAQCAEFVARLERLGRIAALAPREVEPPGSAWLAVRERISAGDRVAPPSVPRQHGTRAARRGFARQDALFTWRAPWLAAAGVVFLLGSAGIYRSRASSSDAPLSAKAAREVGPGGESLALGALLRELEERRPLLAPQTISTVEEQLRAIDAAIAATQRALASDPRNSHLANMLEHSRRQREEYLRTTLSLAAEL